MTPIRHAVDPRRPRRWSRALPGAAARGLGIVALLALVAFPEHQVVAGWEYDCGECFVDGGAGHSKPHVPVTIGRNDTYIGRGEVLLRGETTMTCRDAGRHTTYTVVRRVSGRRPPAPWQLLALEVVTNH